RCRHGASDNTRTDRRHRASGTVSNRDRRARNLRANPQLRRLHRHDFLWTHRVLYFYLSETRGAVSDESSGSPVHDARLHRGLLACSYQHCLSLSGKHIDRNRNHDRRHSRLLVLATEETQMTAAREVMGSAYMNWAKTRSVAKYNLATSGLGNVKLSELRVSLDDLEITDGGYGYQPLIQSIAARYRVAPEEVVTAAGTTFANNLAMAALIKPGDEVLFEHPAYEPMLALARYLGADVKRFSRRFEDRFQPEDLERLVTPKTRLIVITNLHNPSGVLIDGSKMKQI